MPIKLSEFSQISQNRNYNQGSVCIHDDASRSSLYRVNHHHAFTFLNNTRLTAQQNIRVREAFRDALESEGGVSPLLKEELRSRLGLTPETEDISRRPLERREIKRILDMVSDRTELEGRFTAPGDGSKAQAERMLDEILADPNVISPDRRGNAVVDEALRGLALTRTYEKLCDDAKDGGLHLTDSMLHDTLKAAYLQAWTDFRERLNELVPDANAGGARRYVLLGAFGCEQPEELERAIRFLDEMDSHWELSKRPDKTDMLSFVYAQLHLNSTGDLLHGEAGVGPFDMARKIRKHFAEVKEGNALLAREFEQISKMQDEFLDNYETANRVKRYFREFGVTLTRAQLRDICRSCVKDFKWCHRPVRPDDWLDVRSVIQDHLHVIVDNFRKIQEAPQEWRQILLDRVNAKILSQPRTVEAITGMAGLDISGELAAYENSKDHRKLCHELGVKLKAYFMDNYPALHVNEDVSQDMMVIAFAILHATSDRFGEMLDKLSLDEVNELGCFTEYELDIVDVHTEADEMLRKIGNPTTPRDEAAKATARYDELHREMCFKLGRYWVGHYIAGERQPIIPEDPAD